MDKYIFLLFSLPYLLIYILVFIFRKDLRYKLLTTGVLIGIVALITEPFFFKDYWKPPTLMGIGKVSIEEFIFGLSITGATTTCYEVFFKQKLVQKFNTKFVLSTLYSLAFLFIFFIFNIYFNLNTIFTCSIGYLTVLLLTLITRKDLAKPAIFSSLFITTLTIINYLLVSLLSPLYWQKYWLLYNTPLRTMIFGKIPWTEILWYSTFGLICGVFYEFALGLKRENIKPHEEVKAINPFKLTS